MDNKKGVLKIEIFEEFENGKNNVLANVFYFNNTSEQIVWNISEQRNTILEKIDGYTFIIDKRVK